MKLEILITILVFVMAGCFFGEMGYVRPASADVLKGMFIINIVAMAPLAMPLHYLVHLSCRMIPTPKTCL